MDVEKLYKVYYLKVYSFAINIVKDASVAEEITQNTFIKAMSSPKGYEGRSAEYTWLCAIAKNLCFDHFREEKKKEDFLKKGEILPIQESHEAKLIEKQTSLELHRLLHTLEEPYKEVFELRVFGELSFAEIASIFEKTESWARVTYHRARLKIKERMGKNG